MPRNLLLIFASLLLALPGVAAPARSTTAAPQERAAVKTAKEPSLVRVNVTHQAHDFIRPWAKKAPSSRRALGAVIGKERVLVTAELVADWNYIELERAESGEKGAAIVEVVDYETNLAILKPSDPGFLKGIDPLELIASNVGERVSILQLESSGALLVTPAVVTTVEVSRYSVEDTAFLIYRLTSSLQYREGSFTMPVVRNNKLTGLLMRYDPRTQSVDVVPAPVIEHFLKGAASPEAYRGFPRAGMGYGPMRDPQLRRFAGLNGEHRGRGVYVTQIQKRGPADRAGIRVGDVLLAIGEHAVDFDGNYTDSRYGKISLTHLVSTRHFDGDKATFKIFRDGKVQELLVTLAYRPPQDYVVEPYSHERAPRFYMLGGLLLQELSRAYLREWGSEWYKKAPERFLYYDRYQHELFPEGDRKIVFLSHVLPSASTIGYEELRYTAVTRINNVPIRRLADVPTALANPVKGFHKIELEEHPKLIYLDAARVDEDTAAVMATYGLPSQKQLE